MPASPQGALQTSRRPRLEAREGLPARPGTVPRSRLGNCPLSAVLSCGKHAGETINFAPHLVTGLLLPMPRTAIVSARNREVSRDLLFVVLATGLTFVVCAVFELREWLTEITRPLERYQIDELPFTLGALALLLAWFSWRRWRQAAQELQLRVEAQQALMDKEARYR